ncbi:hypothetical protein EYR40_009756 [Pleurotus pulmonarius]|nr:hypothetical protein EYR38_002798 [Pleurotus pulmonarius]KAF4591154.1 hypothetical protein EYR40_009756 [Pleurotus pulmonarius]
MMRPRKKQNAHPDIVEIFSSPSPPPRPLKSKARTEPKEIISLVSDSESEDPPTRSSKPTNKSATANGIHEPLETSLRDLKEIGGSFTNEDEDLVAEQLVPSSTPSSTVSPHPRVPHATPSAIEECLRDGLTTITSVLHLLPPHIVSSLQQSSGSVPRVETPTPTVDAACYNSPQDSFSKPTRPRPRSLISPSTPSDASGPPGLPKEPPVLPTTASLPNPDPPHTPFKTPSTDSVKSPSSSTRKRCRSSKHAPPLISTSVRWVRQTAVENMGCHHSLWSPRLVREEVPLGASDSQQDSGEGGMAVEKNDGPDKSMKEGEGEGQVEEEEDQIDELISSDIEAMGNDTNDTTPDSPPLSVDDNDGLSSSRPSSPPKPHHQSSFSPNLFIRVLNLNLQRSSTSSTPPSLPALLSSLPSAPLVSMTSASSKPPSLLDKLPSLVKTIDTPASPIPNANVAQLSWTMDVDPVDDIEDADFENMVLAYPS